MLDLSIEVTNKNAIKPQVKVNVNVKVKVMFPLCVFNLTPRHEGVSGSEGIAPRILDLGTRWR
jgi:hypothetical protein